MNSSSYFKLLVILITSLILWTLREFLLLIICSLVISNIVCNLCNQIQKGLKIPRSMSLFLVLTFISVIVFTIFILVLPPFIKEFNEILVDIPNGLSKINILINTNLNKLNNLFYGKQSENVIDIFSLINNVVTIPDASTIAIKALDTTYLTSNRDKTINDNKPTDNELITIEKVQFANAILHFSRIFLNLLR